MSYLTSVIDFLVLTWLFWPLLVLIPIVCYFMVLDAVRHEHYPLMPELLLAAVIAAVVYHFPVLHLYAFSWQVWALAVPVYIVAGFGIAFYKWMAVIHDFRASGPAAIIASTRADVWQEAVKANRVKWTGPELVKEVSSRLDRYWDRKAVIEVPPSRCPDQLTQAEFSAVALRVYPNWKKHPIATWWVYWPFFALSVVFDPIERFIRQLTAWLKGVFNGVARKFSVSA